MRQSELFSKTERHAPKDEEALNAQLLARAGFVDKLMAGVYSYLPLGLRVLRKIEQIVREEMNALGAQEILMPALNPKANWARTGRWESYDSLFRFTSHYSKIDYALGPTHEETVSPLAQRFIFSYQDLPRAVFQIQTKFRDEKRVKSGLLRGREFLMKDLYSFHRDGADLDAYYDRVIPAYRKVFDRVGIGGATYLTFASGGTFAKYSHEFQMLTPTGEDTVYLCEACGVAVNKEIIADQPDCPQCGNKDLKERVGAEVGNIFKLKTKYSQPFDLAYTDEKGKRHDVMMGCYGIGISRLMGAIVEHSHDDRGIIWPENVAPMRVHLIELPGGDGAEVYRELMKRGIEALYDDRDVSAGEKFADADLLGIPWRTVVSGKLAGKIELKRRDSDAVQVLSMDEAVKSLIPNP